MSDSSGRTPYDYAAQSDEEEDGEAYADSGQAMNFRRMEARSAGGVATARSHQPSSIGIAPGDAPGFDSETSGESVSLPYGCGSTEASRFVPPGKAHGGHAYAASPFPPAVGPSLSSHGFGVHPQQGPYVAQAQQHKQHPSMVGGSHNPMMIGARGFTNVEPPGFFAPFGTPGKSATEGSSSYDDDSDSPRLIRFPSTFRLERTNFVVSRGRSSSMGQQHEVELEPLLHALRRSLPAVGVDVLDFKPAHCVLECSSHVGNRFLSIFIRVFRAPDRASGQLLETVSDAYGHASCGNAYRGQEDEEDTPFLVEAQLREGDRLHFSALFPEILSAFKNQEGMNIIGTLCYKPRPYPKVGQGLALEEAMKSSRGSLRPLSQRKETPQSGRNTGAGGSVMGASSPLPVPASMAKTSTESDDGFEEDMNEDLMVLTKMIQGNYLDVQADAAMAVAGLTADHGFLRQLCLKEAAQASSALCIVVVRLCLETYHRPARRQAAVVVANLCTIPELCLKLLASDPPQASYPRAPVDFLDPCPQHRGLITSLVVLSMGMHGGESGAAVGNSKEEEIGTRRECMRALVGLAECEKARNQRAMKLLLSSQPSGRGAKDPTLLKRLDTCRAVLKNRS